MSSRWEEYEDASLTDFERRVTRPGGRDYHALKALDNYERELQLRQRARDAALAARDHSAEEPTPL